MEYDIISVNFLYSALLKPIDLSCNMKGLLSMLAVVDFLIAIHRVMYIFQLTHFIAWIKKQDPTICYLKETHDKYKNTHRLRAKGW